MGPERDGYFAPCKEQIGVVVLLLRDCSDAVHELQSLRKVFKTQRFLQMMIIEDFPTVR